MNLPHLPPHDWRKSSYSGTHTNCVEVAAGPVTGIRDTKHRERAALAFSSREWQAFVEAVKTNQL